MCGNECRAASHPLVHGASPLSSAAPDASAVKVKKDRKGWAMAKLVQHRETEIDRDREFSCVRASALAWLGSGGDLQQGNWPATR